MVSVNAHEWVNLSLCRAISELSRAQAHGAGTSHMLAIILPPPRTECLSSFLTAAATAATASLGTTVHL